MMRVHIDFSETNLASDVSGSDLRPIKIEPRDDDLVEHVRE